VKLSGSDLIYRLAAHSARRGLRLLLVGSTPEVNAMAVMRLREQQPELEIAGFAPAGYRIDCTGERAAEAATLEAIKAFEPDQLVFRLGADKEQRLSLRLAPRLDGSVSGLLCFGGAIDVASGQVRQAPAWIQHSGLESLYRVAQRPRRLPA
jgi:N-acetylglucosaminyldiphosphoundecaprenol N-acetyl-beta-D-mannosaminyltransferase